MTEEQYNRMQFDPFDITDMYDTGVVCFKCKKNLECSKHPLEKRKLMQSNAIGRKLDKIKDDESCDSDIDRNDQVPEAAQPNLQQNKSGNQRQTGVMHF